MDLTNQLLIALPNIRDPRFERAVIYICTHNEDGCLGLRVNSPSEDLTIGDTLAQLNLPELDIEALKKNNSISTQIDDFTIEMPPHLFDMPVMNGGPVEHNRGFILHSQEYNLDEETIEISETVSMTSTSRILSDISLGQGPKKICFAIGYVGWQAGQLEEEIAANYWMIVDADDDIIFDHNFEEKYDLSLKILGIKPEMLNSLTQNIGHA